MNHLLCFGLGYSAREFARRLQAEGWRITGTTRNAESAARLTSEGFQTLLFDGTKPSDQLAEAVHGASHVLVSAGPDESGDPTLRCHGDDLANAGGLKWIGYLSTIGVYGDHEGQWVDEAVMPRPVSRRSRWRLAAEESWIVFGEESEHAVQLFRLSGIYGPGRNPLQKLIDGTARRIDKPGQVFNRIHVADIAGALQASIARPAPGRIYNVTDDEPAPPQDVVAYAAELLGLEPPPLIPFDEAPLSPMGRSFYGENTRVSNARLKHELGYEFVYPTYREGLEALLPIVKR